MFLGNLEPSGNCGHIFDFKFVSPSKFFVSTNASFSPSETSKMTRSAGNYSSSLTITMSPTPREPHFVIYPFYSSTPVLFSFSSFYQRFLSSKKSVIIEAAITTKIAGAYVGTPFESDIDGIHYSIIIVSKQRCAGFTSYCRKFMGKKDQIVYLLVCIAFVGFFAGQITNSHRASSSVATVLNLEFLQVLLSEICGSFSIKFSINN